jgi:hypothetical protein
MTQTSDFRSVMTFGTGEGRPSPEFIKRFQEHSFKLIADVPLGVQRTFAEQNHDMSGGSDPLFIIDGLVIQAAAELFAAERIFAGEMAQLTMFHHARAVYEAHAIAYWLCQDVDGRWKRLMKSNLLERQRFESEVQHSMGAVPTDISEDGIALLNDDSVKRAPNMIDMVKTDALLRFDLAMFWKYSSSLVHPGALGAARIDRESERVMIEQVCGGCIRHAAGTFRRVLDRYPGADPDTQAALAAAEEYSAYLFDLPKISDYPNA